MNKSNTHYIYSAFALPLYGDYLFTSTFTSVGIMDYSLCFSYEVDSINAVSIKT